MNRLKFSIIVCTYNRANLLDKGLRTLVFQEYSDFDYEIVVIDDGSTDNTNEIVDKYKETFPYINYKHILNREEYSSPALARNIGLKEAKYEYCCFTDPEILVPYNMLKIHDEIHKGNKNSIICTRPIVMTKEETNNLNKLDLKCLNVWELDKKIPSLLDIKKHKLEMTQKNWKDNHFSSFKREHALKINGVNKNFNKWGFEGIDFVERMVKSGLNLINVDKVYHMYHDAPRDMKLANEQRLKFGVKGCGES